DERALGLLDGNRHPATQIFFPECFARAKRAVGFFPCHHRAPFANKSFVSRGGKRRLRVTGWIQSWRRIVVAKSRQNLNYLKFPLSFMSSGYPQRVDNVWIVLPVRGRMSAIWESALSSIETKIKRHNFEMWFKPIDCAAIDGDRIVLRAPNRYIKEWFEDNY